jgi:hypothetical protein
MTGTTNDIPGYTYGTPAVAVSTVTLDDLRRLRISAGFTEEDERYLRMAGSVLEDQVERVVNHWRANIIASIPHLARHSRNLDGSPNPDYLAKQSALPAMDSGYVPASLRSGLAQLSTGNRPAAYNTQEEPDRQRDVHIACALQRYPRFPGGSQRDHQTVSASQRTRRVGCCTHARSVVQIDAHSDGTLGEAVYGSGKRQQAMVTARRVT